jgi:hypothetical protein
MVEDRITDGRRIAQLLASELDGRTDGRLRSITVTNADPDIEPTDAGARAYDVATGDTTVATVFVHPERVRIETGVEGERLEAFGSEGLTRVSGMNGPGIVVEHGAAVKGAVDVLVAAIEPSD